ncbi:hypothetical protein ENUP19_0340G0023 [Entamoeba nuttalli]|uniref:Uncharacterized protein n=2 Tax=Entamoeba nuttalli TaxID=412467 RepID=K2HFV4_ENTNP|nr:hypothetical protein ENU1_047180 [Entamoeba nuttalli P19]EKE41694.1 hypothetical protein ENU1_047180 [Entamoeba nuttalli P19]|eukprot:XP_008855962.1 hypothetical protein ENU1_047180 [Entamoeba nuttalli P19]
MTLLFYFIVFTFSKKCLVSETVAASKGLTTLTYPSIQNPTVSFKPELNGNYLISNEENALKVFLDLNEEQTVQICIGQQLNALTTLTVNPLSLQYLYRTVFPLVPFYLTIVYVFVIIIITFMVFRFIAALVCFFTDIFCNQGKRVYQYFDANFGVLEDELFALLKNKSIITQEEYERLSK